MLPFFFDHYDRFVDRYFIFDDGSTDSSTAVIAKNKRASLSSMPPRSDPNSRIASGIVLQEAFWKPSRGKADWVVVTDIDEHIHHQDMRNYLSRCKRAGITIIPSIAFDMISGDFPKEGVPIFQQVTWGAPQGKYNKMNIFDPNAIRSTNFASGRHSAKPDGVVVAPSRDETLLLHFRYLGFERIWHRHQDYLARQKPGDLERRWGVQYSWSRDQLREKWEDIEQRAIDLRTADWAAAASTSGNRWWHGYARAEPSD